MTTMGGATEGSVAQGGATIRYWITGEPRNGTVVCTHGATLDHEAFSTQVPVLGNAGYRVICWDLRGHGASQQQVELCRFRDAADDLLAVMDDAGVERAVLLGQSFGGFVTQDLCRRVPERVASLVLIGTPPLGRRPPWPYFMIQRTRPLALRLWPEAHLRRLLPAFMSRDADVQRYVAQATRTMSKAGIIAVTEAALEAFGHRDDERAMPVPTLFTHGEREDPMVVRLIASWVGDDPMSERHVVPAAGHLANQDRPAAFNPVLLAFLASRQGRGQGMIS